MESYQALCGLVGLGTVAVQLHDGVILPKPWTVGDIDLVMNDSLKE